MIPDEVRTILQGVLGDKTEFVIIAFFVLSAVLVNYRRVRDLYFEFLPRRRRERDILQRMKFAEQLTELKDKQLAAGVSFVDVEALWTSRFPEPFAFTDTARVDPSSIERASPMKLIAYAIVPWLFASIYLLFVGGATAAFSEEVIGLSEDALLDAMVIAFLFMPLLLTVYGLVRTPQENWQKGYFSVMGPTFVRILWAGLLYMPLATLLLHLTGLTIPE